MRHLTVTRQAYGYACEIRNAAGFLLAYGFANAQLGEDAAKALAVNRALAQIMA